MSPSADAMALSTSSHNLSSSSRSSSTDSMGVFTGSKHGISRFLRKFGLKKDEPNVPAPIDTKTANADTGNSRNRKGPKTVIPKPGMNRTESERRDRLVEAPLSPTEKRLQRLNPRGTSTSLAPIQSRSVGDLNESVGQGVDERRRSYVDPKLSSTHTPTSYSRNSQSQPSTSATAATTVSAQPLYGRQSENQLERQTTVASTYDTRSLDSRSNYGGPGPAGSSANAIDDTLDWRWILNLSMHFRDHSHREKFFVTYAEKPNLRRRVTVSCDYRHPEPGSLEDDLSRLKSQKEKSNRIYESIKEALTDIKFYETTTNLKLHTQEGRLNVHVTEDMHEIIYYPPVSAISHLDCAKIRESDLAFDSHLSGFVYKVMHGTQVYIKKEIPSPDTVDEFLYEINALYALRDSDHVIKFGGCILDDKMEKVKGLLISFAPKGALIDVLYNERNKLPWSMRESWAREIVGGLADIHEGGYVQGDFTLSNIVIDEDDTAKIIDINRRGCPVGWEPPEITIMLEGLQRIGIYIGIKSDIFQLGMCLWAIAMQNDEPEYETRPLSLKYAPADVPEWYKEIVALCLAPTPQARPGAKELLSKFPPPTISNSEPLSPIVYEARFDDANLSSPPSPAQLGPQYIQMNGVKYEMPLPDTVPNMIDSEENYEGFEAGIEQNTKLGEEVIQPMGGIVDGEPVTTHPHSQPRDPALAAASAAWKHGSGLNGDINGTGSITGSGNGNGIASKPVKPALEIPTNGNITNNSSGVNGNGKGKLPTVPRQTAERAVKRSSGASGLSGRDSPVPARHTDSGFAEIAGEESPVSPKTIPAPSRIGASGSNGGIGSGGRR